MFIEMDISFINIVLPLNPFLSVDDGIMILFKLLRQILLNLKLIRPNISKRVLAST